MAPMPCSRTPKWTLRPAELQTPPTATYTHAFDTDTEWKSLFRTGAPLDLRAEVHPRLVGNEERGLDRPAQVLLGGPHLVRAQRSAVGVKGPLLVRSSEPDDRPHHEQRRSVGDLLGFPERGVHRRQVIPILDALHVPAVGREPRAHVLPEGDRCRARERDAIVVVEDDQLAELEVAGERAGLGLDPLHHVAVARDDVGTCLLYTSPSPRDS